MSCSRRLCAGYRYADPYYGALPHWLGHSSPYLPGHGYFEGASPYSGNPQKLTYHVYVGWYRVDGYDQGALLGLSEVMTFVAIR